MAMQKYLNDVFPFISKFDKTTFTSATNTDKQVATAHNQLIDSIVNTNLYKTKGFDAFYSLVGQELEDDDTAATMTTALNKIRYALILLKHKSQVSGMLKPMFMGFTIPDAVETSNTANNVTLVNALGTIFINRFRISE